MCMKLSENIERILCLRGKYIKFADFETKGIVFWYFLSAG